MLQSVNNLGSVAIANYAERRGNWRFVFGAEATVEAFRFLRKVDCDGAIVRILSPAMKREAMKVRVPIDQCLLVAGGSGRADRPA